VLNALEGRCRPRAAHRQARSTSTNAEFLREIAKAPTGIA
jgi:hypothetical protein